MAAMVDDRPDYGTILDVGMDQCQDTEFYLKKGFRVVAVDASPEACARAQRRFAREVADWLTHAVKELGVHHIGIFAASRFLGLLRQELGDLSKQADLHEGELTRLRPQELSTHPAIVHALEYQTGTHQPSS